MIESKYSLSKLLMAAREERCCVDHPVPHGFGHGPHH